MKRTMLLLCVFGFLAGAGAELTGQIPPSEEVLTDRVLVKTLQPLPPGLFVAGECVDPAGHSTLKALSGLDEDVQIRRAFRRPPRGWRDPGAAGRIGLDRWVVVHLERKRTDAAEVTKLASRIAALPGVELCELDVYGHAADTTPNDPMFANQYALQNGKLNAPRAWDILTDSSHVIAVIDSGADLDHTDLVGNLWQNPEENPGNGLDDDNNGYIDDVVGWDLVENDNSPDDIYGHGIHVCGIAGASTNNSLKTAGVCWSVPIMVVRILDDAGGCPMSRAAAGIVYAADNGASVLNNSWGYVALYQILADAVLYAEELDTVIVAAAHNQGGTSEIYPAAMDEAMGIIATDIYDNKTSWSNYGSWCDMAAPGDNILSLWLYNGTTYGYGTSMSTPFVAGAAALVREVNPALDAESTRWILNRTSVDLGAPGFDPIFGWGRLDLAAAVEKALWLTASGDILPQGGGTIDFHLSAGAGNAGRNYVMVGGVSGIEPGTPLPGGLATIPLNRDWFTDFILDRLNMPAFTGFSGTLDASGESVASLNAPPLNANWVGKTVHFAFAIKGPWDTVSNAVAIDIIP